MVRFDYDTLTERLNQPPDPTKIDSIQQLLKSIMGLELTQKQYRLMYEALKRYQYNCMPVQSPDYKECLTILDALHDFVYTQQREQST